jgi:hypothetical protein
MSDDRYLWAICGRFPIHSTGNNKDAVPLWQ